MAAQVGADDAAVIRAIGLREGAGEAAVTAVLDHGDRHRRRLMVDTTEGERVLLDLPEAVALADGARLALSDGRTLVVRAADEDVADIAAGPTTSLATLAWHLGNRHTPTAIFGDRLRIRRDHVLEAMVAGLGGTVTHAFGPFDPEAGAYHSHGHRHSLRRDAEPAPTNPAERRAE